MAQRVHFSVLAVFMFCQIAVPLVLLTLFRQPDAGAELTSSPPLAPESLQWTAGSAFSTVTATCFGFYAQPRGSLLFNKSGRVWRLSPLYALADTITIFWVWTYSLGRAHQVYDRWPSLRTIAVSILIMRLANDEDALKNTSGVKRHSGPRPRTGTEPDGITIPQLFEQARDFERGPSFRFFVWIPMILQLVKLIVVHGSVLPRSIGIAFFAAWFVNDVILIVASVDALSETERAQAAYIIDDCNPQAMQLVPGSNLKVLRHTAVYAQSMLSIFLIAAFATGGWENVLALREPNATVFSQLGQVCTVLALALWCHHGFLMSMDCLCQVYKSGRVDEHQKLLYEGTAAYSAIADWILRLLCFLAMPPFEWFHDVTKTEQPTWYEWLG